jgi:hypothetical protein
MKLLFVAAFLVVSFYSFSQNGSNEIDLKNWEAPYKLDVPDGWSSEAFLIPIEFAPSIPYKGVEDLRFAPGWSDVKSPEYWTYAFLWYLDKSPEVNAEIISKNLKDYYSGLIKSSVDKRKTPSEKIIPVKTSLAKIDPISGDNETYSGTIHLFDYMNQKPLTLNCIVHKKTCVGQSKTFIFFEISPKPIGEGVWKGLDKLWADFACNK